MSINIASKTGITNNKRDIAPVYNVPESYTPTPYVRPTEWLTLPSVSPTEQKIVALVAVFDNSSNYQSLSCFLSGGTYTVDWGDGTSTSTQATGVQADHLYSFSSIDPATTTSFGYRQVIITITVTGGNLTKLDLTTPYNVASLGLGALPGGFNNRILDLRISGPYQNSMKISSNTGNSSSGAMLEQIEILSTAASCNFSGTFTNCRSLKKIIFPAGMKSSNCNNMFASCTELQSVPLFDTSTCTDFTSMFNGCFGLIDVPTFDTSSATTMTSMFSNCYTLTYCPPFNTANVTVTTAMFQYCQSLITVPKLDLGKVTSSNQMFQYCYALKTIPLLTFKVLQNSSSMFWGCYNLLEIPQFNLSTCTDVSGMFRDCRALKTSPAFNLPIVTTIATMYYNCMSIITIGKLTTGTALTTMSQSFAYCFSLVEVPEVTNTINVTTVFELFYQDMALSSANITYNLSNCTIHTGMFGFCNSLQTINSFDTTKSTSMSRMFNGCSIIDAPNLNMSNVTDASLMFYQANSLRTVPTYDTTKVTNMNAMFQVTPQLLSIPTLNSSNCTNFAAFAQGSGIYYAPSLDTSKATSVNNMFNGCLNLITIPAYNIANSTSDVSLAATCPSLTSSGITGTKTSISYTNTMMNRDALETVFTNLTPNTTAQTITITGSLGTGSWAKTGNIVAASNVITIANTVGITTGMYVYAANVNSGIGVTAYTPNSLRTTSLVYSSNSPQEGAEIIFTTAPTGLTVGTPYFMKNVNTNNTGTFQVAYSNGVIVTNMSGTGVMTLGGAVCNRNQVVAVNANSNVIINGTSWANANATAITFRNLNTGIALTKNWVVTG